jgi:Ftsk gamma domain
MDLELDEYFFDAAELVVIRQEAKTSLIQRELKLGYNRSGEIIDQLERHQIISPFNNSIAGREVLVKSLKELEIKLIEIRQNLEKSKKAFGENKSQLILDLDKNSDGQIDLIENAFEKLLSKNQKQIAEVDKNYIHQFVKISIYIKNKNKNIQSLFESIKNSSDSTEMNERVSLLYNQVHSYELLIFHSINMIGAINDDNLIAFYEIYESFDKLGIFNSNWENEISSKLNNIGDKLDEILESINSFEQNIVGELNHLSYTSQESFSRLSDSVTSQLKGVESSINFNNLLTGIQTYQLYKINQNTKRIN